MTLVQFGMSIWGTVSVVLAAACLLFVRRMPEMTRRSATPRAPG